MLNRTLAVIALMSLSTLPSVMPSAHAQSVNEPPSPLEKNYTLTEDDQALLLSLIARYAPINNDAQIKALKAQWSPAFIPPSLEIFQFITSARIRAEILAQLTESTGQDFGDDINAWYRWLWNEDAYKIFGYDDFKSRFYKEIDPHFDVYFKGRAQTARIRLDEIRWGGVRQDGIPPLRQPKMLSAKKARYLDDDDIVFGIEVNGDARAYPKRILAWHEMFVDTVGGIDVAGVYCTLCGTVILYETTVDNVAHAMGTSGFLYRSNKLMYDKETQSLWNTIMGEPVLGPLVGQDITLPHHSVVTTTWGAWRKRHPKTKVLSKDTGYNRDYGEGVAYHDYFATDNLMFNTPYNDQRLKNKDEVLALRFKAYPREQLAVSVRYLKDNPVYTDRVGEQAVLVLTDKSGANRVYDPQDISFDSYDGNSTIIDSTGQVWRLEESKLVAENGKTLPRLPYHRAFWFGWHATYPNSRLVK